LTICSTGDIDLTTIGASITGGATSGTWTSSGDGSFDGDGAFGTATTYTPGSNDISGGSVTLTLISSESIAVTIEPEAEVALDSDLSICSTEGVDLTSIGASITGGTTSGTWSSSGTGSFDGDSVFGTATTYTPSEADIDAGSITITLTSADPEGTCDPDSASITIEVLDIRCSEFPWSGND